MATVSRLACGIFVVSLGCVAGASAAAPKGVPAIAAGSAYRQVLHASSVTGLAPVLDPFLIEPFGLAASPSSPFWIANTRTGTAGLYREPVGSDVLAPNTALPRIMVPGGLAVGVVHNPGAAFVITAPNGANDAATFLFATLGGSIAGWNANVPDGSTAAIVAASVPGHVFTGLALANNSGTDQLYAADFANLHIDVFGPAFTQAVGPFADAGLSPPPGSEYSPFNVRAIGNQLYVTYAKLGIGSWENGAGNGYVRRYNPDGTRDATFAIDRGQLDAPWGIALAPPTFGIFGSALLVGNLSPDGRIHAYNPNSGAFLGTLQDEGGNPIEIDGLRGLHFGNGGNGGDAATLYFTAALENGLYGLIGSFSPTTATATSVIAFSADDYDVAEGGSINITVLRDGDSSGAATVRYAAVPAYATGRAAPEDYVLAAGTLSFAQGDTSKTFTVRAVRDTARPEIPEALRLMLANPAGTGVGLGRSRALLTITDAVFFGNGFE